MSDEQRPKTTTDSGIPAASDEFSLTVGPQGPTVLHDHGTSILLPQEGRLPPDPNLTNFGSEFVSDRAPRRRSDGARDPTAVGGNDRQLGAVPGASLEFE